MTSKRCNRCHRPMKGTTAYDGACACGGLIEALPRPPSDCTCLWTHNGDSGNVYISMPDCPAKPHPRTYDEYERLAQ